MSLYLLRKLFLEIMVILKNMKYFFCSPSKYVDFLSVFTSHHFVCFICLSFCLLQMRLQYHETLYACTLIYWLIEMKFDLLTNFTLQFFFSEINHKSLGYLHFSEIKHRSQGLVYTFSEIDQSTLG